MFQTKMVNDTFSNAFHKKVKLQPTVLSDTLANINEMIEDIILDYKFNRDSQRSYLLITDLEQTMNELFERLNKGVFKDTDMDSLTHICLKINENVILTEIRDIAVFERLSTQENNSSKTQDDKTPISKDSPQPVEQGYTNKENRNLVSTEKVNERKEEISKTAKIEDKRDESSNIVDERKENIPEENTGLKEINKIEEIFAQMKENYELHKIDNAYKLHQQAKNLINLNSLNDKLQDFVRVKTEENKQLMDDIEMFQSFCSRVLCEMGDETGYHLEKVKNHCTIKYKCASGENIGLKIEGIVDVPLFNMLSLMNEPEGYTKWMPFCGQAVLTKQLTRASKTFWTKCDMPPPIFNREMYIVGAGFDRLNVNGSILIVGKSIQEDKHFKERFELDIPAKSKLVRMAVEYMGMELIPLSKDKTHMKIVAKFDPKIKFLPLALANWVVRKMAQHLLDKLVKRASHFKGTIWEKKIQEDRVFYGWLEQIVEDFLVLHNLGS